MAQAQPTTARRDPARTHAALPGEILRRLKEMLPPADGPYALHEPLFSGNEKKYVNECIDTGWVSSAGPFVDRFEADLSSFTGLHAVATVNGTAALHTCLVLAGVQPGDEVLVPALTFVATANAVAYCGAQPHFIDSEEDTLGPDPDKLTDHLEMILAPGVGSWHNHRTGRPVRALIATHVFGHPPKLDRLRVIADHYGLVLIEDAAEALGTYYHGTHAGGIGNYGALSFNGNKTITTGGGGAVVTKHPKAAVKAKHLTTTARVADPLEWRHNAVGYNYRLPNINGALGCAPLEQLPSFLAAKRRLAEEYVTAFDDLDVVAILREPAGASSNYWLNTLLLHPSQAKTRRPILTAVDSAGYQCRPFWTPLHRLPMFAGCPAMPLQTAESLVSRGLNLPSGPALRLG